MQLITDEYRKLNTQLHTTNKHYGVSGVHYLNDVIQILKELQSQDLLDYGCGKGTLAMNLPFTIKQYDPAIPKHAALPVPADVITCTDVLEHIEPELIDNVLAHIRALTLRKAYLSVCTIPAKKTLPDGRNAHILLRPYKWWMDKMYDYFDINNFFIKGQNLIFIVTPKKQETH